jgi:hypothetical protein
MAEPAKWIRILGLVTAGVLFLIPFYNLLRGIPPQLLHYHSISMVTLGAVAVGLASSSFSRAAAASSAYALLAMTIYALFSFGRFDALYLKQLAESSEPVGDIAFDTGMVLVVWAVAGIVGFASIAGLRKLRSTLWRTN